jgi:hypothetical protein
MRLSLGSSPRKMFFLESSMAVTRHHETLFPKLFMTNSSDLESLRERGADGTPLPAGV